MKKDDCLAALEDAKEFAEQSADRIYEERSRAEYDSYHVNVYTPADLALQTALEGGFSATQSQVDQAISGYNEAKSQMEEALEDLRTWSEFMNLATEWITAVGEIKAFFV